MRVFQPLFIVITLCVVNPDFAQAASAASFPSSIVCNGQNVAISATTSFNDIGGFVVGTSLTANVTLTLPANATCSVHWEVDRVVTDFYTGFPGRVRYGTVYEFHPVTVPSVGQITLTYAFPALNATYTFFQGLNTDVPNTSSGLIDTALVIPEGGTTTTLSLDFTLTNVQNSPFAVSFSILGSGVFVTEPLLSITSSSPLPPGTVNVPYSQALQAYAGIPPYTWSLVSGTLPTGLTLSNAGVISGTPGSAGLSNFQVRVTDSLSTSATQAFSLSTFLPGAVSITTPQTLTSGTTGVAYSQALAASGGNPPYTWSITSGSLPQGLAVSNAGAISGTPNASGTSNFTARVTDIASSSATRTFSLTIASGVSIVTPLTLPSGTTSTFYSQTLIATGGSLPYAWSVISGALPVGLTLANSGAITGIPTIPGTSNFTARVTDATSVFASQTFSITVSSGLTLTTSLVLPSAAVGVFYSQTLAASGGNPPYTWSLLSGALPSGLAFSSAGAITGTPSATGTLTFTVRVTDSASSSATQTFSLSVSSGLTITTPFTLPSGTTGTFYSRTVAASGGKPPYTWTLTSGALPAGLTLSSAGPITGTPTVTGTSNFGLRVTDSASASATQAFSLTVTTDSLNFTSALRIAQVAEGAGWKTLFALVNLDQSPASYVARFWDDNGNPLQIPILNGINGTLSGTVAPGATVFAETPGTSPTLLQGWAEVASSGRIGVSTIFRQSVPGRPDSEGTVSGTLSGNRIFLPFDNTKGYVTSVALANTNPNQGITVSLLFQLDNGAQSTGSLFLPPHAHTAFVLPVMFPSLASERGSVQFTAPSTDITVVGLRTNPTNSFTSLEAFQ